MCVPSRHPHWRYEVTHDPPPAPMSISLLTVLGVLLWAPTWTSHSSSPRRSPRQPNRSIEELPLTFTHNSGPDPRIARTSSKCAFPSATRSCRCCCSSSSRQRPNTAWFTAQCPAELAEFPHLAPTPKAPPDHAAVPRQLLPLLALLDVKLRPLLPAPAPQFTSAFSR